MLQFLEYEDFYSISEDNKRERERERVRERTRDRLIY